MAVHWPGCANLSAVIPWDLVVFITGKDTFETLHLRCNDYNANSFIVCFFQNYISMKIVKPFN